MVKRQLIGLSLVVVGLGIIGIGFAGPFATYQDVQSHETTEANVLSTGMESAEEVEEGETEVEYYPRIEYEYTVDDETYTDTVIYHPSQVDDEPGELDGREFDERSDAEAVVDDYSEGETATLYYDPADPEVSYLRDPSSDILISVVAMGLFGVLFVGLGLGGVTGRISLEG